MCTNKLNLHIKTDEAMGYNSLNKAMKKFTLIISLCFLFGNISQAQNTVSEEKTIVDTLGTVIVDGIKFIDSLIIKGRLEGSEMALQELQNENPELAGCYTINSSGKLVVKRTEKCSVGGKIYYNISCPECVLRQQRLRRCQAQTYLFGVTETKIKSTYKDFEKGLYNNGYEIDIYDLGRVWYVREGETNGSWVQKFGTSSIWNEGRTYIYVGTQGDYIKFVDIEFYDAQSKPNMGGVMGQVGLVFKEDCGYGSRIAESSKHNEYDDMIITWMRPDNVKITLIKRMYKDSTGELDLKNCKHKEVLQYDVL